MHILGYTFRGEKGGIQNLKGSRYNHFGSHVEPLLQMVLHGTRKGSPMKTAEEPFWNPSF